MVFVFHYGPSEAGVFFKFFVKVDIFLKTNRLQEEVNLIIFKDKIYRKSCR